mmetsp:Transcript_22737/g.49815  ORF Transcript_22737/g.49815 Transcript_22737/m.49815 type:complete len:225 (-) Transcript_22737:397-1071(-)
MVEPLASLPFFFEPFNEILLLDKPIQANPSLLERCLEGAHPHPRNVLRKRCGGGWGSGAGVRLAGGVGAGGWLAGLLCGGTWVGCGGRASRGGVHVVGGIGAAVQDAADKLALLVNVVRANLPVGEDLLDLLEGQRHELLARAGDQRQRHLSRLGSIKGPVHLRLKLGLSRVPTVLHGALGIHHKCVRDPTDACRSRQLLLQLAIGIHSHGVVHPVAHLIHKLL